MTAQRREQDRKGARAGARGRATAVVAPARTRWAAVVAVVLGVAGVPGACSLPTEMPELVLLEPAQAYSDMAVLLRIETRHLRPALRLDAQGGEQSPDLTSVRMRLLPQGDDAAAAAVPLELLEWNPSDVFWARVPPGLPAGPYALELTDARGARAALWRAFVELGPDTTPPQIEVDLADGATLGSGGTIAAHIVADDGAGVMDSVRWQVLDGEEQDCFPAPDGGAATTPAPALPPTLLPCTATFTAPLVGDGQPTIIPWSLRVWARDVAGNEAVRDLHLQVAKKPIVASFAGRVGALGGRQPFTVQGRFFIPGSEALVGGVPLIGGVLTSREDGTAIISGWTPPRARAESVGVEVRSPAGIEPGEGFFTYLPPPRPRDVQPPTAPSRGGIRVIVRGNDLRTNAAVIYVGASRETRQPLYNVTWEVGNRVSGCVPPGTGTVSLWAYDPLTGDGELPMSLTYLDPPAGDQTPATTDATCVPR